MTDRDKFIFEIAKVVIDHYRGQFMFNSTELRMITDQYVKYLEEIINKHMMDDLIREFKDIEIRV